VPAQAVLRAGALGDKVVAVIGQQPDLHRALVQEGGRKPLDPVAQDGAGGGQRVDLVGLAGFAFAASRAAHQPRRDADHAFAGSDERLLSGAHQRPTNTERSGRRGLIHEPPEAA
jgi:hypothetical protein